MAQLNYFKYVLNELQQTKFIATEAEEALIGCILLDSEVLDEVRLIVSNPELLFSQPQNATTIKAMVEMRDSGMPIDLITFAGFVRERDLSKKIGGIARISEMESIPPSSSNYALYLEILVKALKWRNIQKISLMASFDRIERYEGDPDTFASELTEAAKQILNQTHRKESHALSKQCRGALEIIERTYQSKGVTGLSTGYKKLDRMIDGLRPGDMVIIAARPSIGKTSFSMNIAEFVALELNESIAVFSLEMTAESLIARMAYSRSMVSKKAVQSGAITEADLVGIGNAINMIAASKLIIEDKGVSRLIDILSVTKELVRKKKVRVILVDYIQIVQTDGRTRNDEISKISSNLKLLGKELGITIIILSQLSRDPEKQGNRKPKLSDLRESGSLEQDADAVVFLHNEEGTSNPGMNELDCIVAKSRDGETGSFKLEFNKQITRFYEKSLIREDEIPK